MKKVAIAISFICLFIFFDTTEAHTPPFTLIDFIKVYATAHKISPDLVIAMIRVESSGNSRAISSANCRGLMQVSHAIWKIFMKEPWEDVFDPLLNIQCGIKYLSDLSKTHNSLEKVLRTYHSGNPNTKSLATARYVKKVLYQAKMAPDIRWKERKEKE